MYVVEDVSDVEALEQKMKEQKEEVSKKAGVIQELAGNKKEDLQNFLMTVMNFSNYLLMN